MTVTLKKVDGGLQLVIPSALAAEAGLAHGAEVTVSVGTGRVTAETAPTRPRRYTLEELVAGITPENLHGEWDVGPPVGKERFWEDDEQRPGERSVPRVGLDG